jgi:uncharacterized protein YunC (DUF1805 family)
MPDPLPRTTSRPIQFDNGCAIGMSHRWEKGQYCSILTKAGIVGCGIYDLTPQAASLGIQTGMTGREAVEKLLQAEKK